MKKKIKPYFYKTFKLLKIWTRRNLEKIILVIILHLVFSYLMSLPYLNLSVLVISFAQYLIDWIIILIVFKPKKELIIRVSLYLFAFSALFGLFKIEKALELLGALIYFLIFTYLVISVPELKKD